jgi:hypothetical protein
MLIPLKKIAFQSSSRDIHEKLRDGAEFNVVRRGGEILLTVVLRNEAGGRSQIFQGAFDEFLDRDHVTNLRSPDIGLDIKENENAATPELTITLTLDEEEFSMSCEDFLDVLLVDSGLTPHEAACLVSKKVRDLNKQWGTFSV